MFEENDLHQDPDEILEAAALAISDLIPEKSKERYEKVYNNFKNRYKEKKLTAISENVLLAYFSGKSLTSKSSTLWSTYSMLKSMINLKDNINISKYSKLITYLKRKSSGYQPKKAGVFSREEVNRFIAEAPDKEFLMMKVILIIGLAGACRCDELCKMSLDDIENANQMLIVKIPDTKTNKPRRFVIVDEENSQRNITLVNKYVALRQSKTPHRRLFVNYIQGKCTIQAVGIHTFGKIPSKIATFLGLPNALQYTGHSLRRTSATLLVDAGGDLTCLKRHGGWRSSTVAEGYIEDSLQNKVAIAKRITAGEENSSNVPSNVPGSSKSLETATDLHDIHDGINKNTPQEEISEVDCMNKNISSALPGINIANVQNTTININIKY